MAEILIQAGADVNAMKEDGHTPLLMALLQVSVRFWGLDLFNPS